MLNDDRLLPPEPGVRQIARRLYHCTKKLPLVSPHGHCDPNQFAGNEAYGDPAFELVTKDHYILRLLYSQGISLEALGVSRYGHEPAEKDGRKIWRLLADHYHLFRGTPSKLWFDATMSEVFGIDVPFGPETSDQIYDQISLRLEEDGFRPRAMFERFGLELLATTNGATDPLRAHSRLDRSGWTGRVVPTFRPDDVVDPERGDFHQNISRLADLSGQDTTTWHGYLDAIRNRRAFFIDAGATASDHGHPSPATVDLSDHAAEALFDRVVKGDLLPGDPELFRGLMLVQMAAMSQDDGLVLQLHTGSWRDHNRLLVDQFGRDLGGDIPRSIDYVGGLKALLDRFGNDPDLTVVVYTLDESTYSRELAPLAGHYPALRLGPPWWFLDSPEGIRRYYQLVIETAGFANTVGFNDDARSLWAIPARHDLFRRASAGFLAHLVAEHLMEESDAAEVAVDLAYNLPRQAFRVG